MPKLITKHAIQLLESLSLLRHDPALCDVYLQGDANCAADELADEAGGEAAGHAGGTQGAWAHRAILAAASPYLHNLFLSIEERRATVTIKNVAPATLRAVVDYIYSPRCMSVTVKNAQTLLSAAVLLDVTSMCDAISRFLRRELAPNNAVGFRAIAKQHGSTVLAERAFNYINNHFEHVLQADELLALAPDVLATLLDDLTEPAEEHILDAVLRWTQHRPQERQQHLFELLQHVRLLLLPTEVVADLAYVEPLVSAESRVQRLLFETLAFHHRPDRAMTVANTKCYQPRRPRSALLVVGGWNMSGYSCNVMAYELSTARWEQAASIPGPRGGAGVAVLDNRVYIVGGDDGDGRGEHVGLNMEEGRNNSDSRCLNSVVVYDVATGTWSPGPALIIARRFVNVAVLNGLLYVAGGWDETGTAISSVEVLDPREGVWRAVASMSTGRASAGLAALDGELYALGGYNGSAALNTVEKYNPSFDSWDPVEDMSEKRWGAGVTVLEDALYVVGGCNGSKLLSSVERFHFEMGWEPAPSMITARYDTTVTAHAGRLYAVGGRGEREVILSSVEVFNPPIAAWSQLPTDMPDGHTEAAAVVVQWPPPGGEKDTSGD